MRPPTSLLLVPALLACASRPITGEVTTQTVVSEHTTTNDGNAATYEILVRTPPGYADDTAARYPLIVQLDATFNDEFAVDAGIVSALEADGTMPPAIVVGIGHPPGGNTPQRDRDFGAPGGTSTLGFDGHADDFLAFLREQLVPWVDDGWRTTGAVDRTLSGHSSGGAFAFWAFTHDPIGGPILFEHVISADWGFDAGAFDDEAALAARGDPRPGSLTITHALYNGAGQAMLYDALVGHLRDHAYVGLRLHAEELPTDHGGAIARSIDAGLRFAFGGQE